MTSANKHKERSKRTNTGILFRSEDKAKHDIIGGVTIFKPKTEKPSKFLEDREGGNKIIEAYEKGRKKKNVGTE
jgi:hypothetical protein